MTEADYMLMSNPPQKVYKCDTCGHQETEFVGSAPGGSSFRASTTACDDQFEADPNGGDHD